MNILLIGEWRSKIHEERCHNALSNLGHIVTKFKWYTYFETNNNLLRFFYKFQNKYLIGPKLNKINNKIIKINLAKNFDAIFIYRGSLIKKETLIHIKKDKPNIKIIGYNNDNPFSKDYPKWLWRHFIKCIPYYDLVCAYRIENINQLYDLGAKKVELLRSWYDPEFNYPIKLNSLDKKKYGCDIVFVGHYEDDERVECLKKLVVSGFNVKIWGPGYDWDPILLKIPELKHLVPIQLVWEEEYNKAICGAKIALCFLSKLNKDTYTRRCFEIPACEVMMLSSYSDDLNNLFINDNEIVMFKTVDELISKSDYYLKNSIERNNIAKNGKESIKSNKHDIKNRMKSLIYFINQL